MTSSLSSLQASLHYADSCYRRPQDLEFHHGTSLPDPKLTVSTKNLLVLTYRIWLAHLHNETQSLLLTVFNGESKARLAHFKESIASRRLVVDGHVRKIFMSRVRHNNASKSRHAFILLQLTPPPFVAGASSSFPESPVSTLPELNSITIASATATAAATRDPMEQANPNARTEESAVPIIRSIPSNHYNLLNDAYNFFSISPSSTLIRPLRSATGYPLYFKDMLSNCLNEFLFWKKDDLINIANAHNVNVASSSHMRTTAEQYIRSLLQHVCDHRCTHLVFCFVPMSRARALKTIGNRERIRDTRPAPFPTVPLAAGSTYRKPTTQLRNAIIKEWQALFTTANQKWGVCASCSRRYRDVLLQRYAATSINFAKLRNPDLPHILLPRSYALAEYDYAILNPKGLSNVECKTGQVKLCDDCNAEIGRAHV